MSFYMSTILYVVCLPYILNGHPLTMNTNTSNDTLSFIKLNTDSLIEHSVSINLTNSNKTDGLNQFNQEESNNWKGRDPIEGDLFQGDIMLNNTLGGIAVLNRGEESKWKFGLVPYEIVASDYTNSQIDIIYQGMRLIEEQTKVGKKDCIKFVPRTNQQDYIRILSDTGCYSYIGRTSGMQTVSLKNPGCLYVGIVAHELIHALGFGHEQTRPDRDNYIIVNYDNIDPKNAHNFDIVESNFDYLGIPYDYYSIMHYESNAFSINGKQTIIPRQSGVTLLPSYEKFKLTDIDVAELRTLYRCGNSDLISWNECWAYACDFDFEKNDLTSIISKPESCGPECDKNPQCTHFTWTNYNGGTCWMKKGLITKSQALYTADFNMVCGIKRCQNNMLTGLKNKATGLVLDSNGNGDVYTLVGNGGDFQKWKILATSDGFLNLINLATGRVLESDSNGSVFTSLPNNEHNQMWKQDGEILVNRATARALDSNHAGNVYSTLVNGGDFQKWLNF